MITISRAFLIVALACATLVSCSSTQRPLMAGTRMKLRSYEHLKVGILPVRVNPTYESATFDEKKLEKIQRVVRDELHRSTPIDASLIAAGDLGEIHADFPLTPGQLATIGQQLKLDAVIGVNILAWSPPSGVHRARISLVIAFAHADIHEAGKAPEPGRDRWVLSSTWKSQTVDALPQTLQNQLGDQFRELNGWLKSGLLSFHSEHGAPEDPILTFFSPLSDTPMTEQLTRDKTLDIVLTAIDDDGIETLTVANPAAGYTWPPPPAPAAPSDSTAAPSPLPIFISAPLTIPLAYGSNAIEVVATDKYGNVTRRPISWRSTSRQGLQLLGIGIEKYPGLRDASGATDAVENLASLRAPLFASVPDLLVDDEARPARVQQTLHDARNALGVNDEYLIVLAGRGGVTRDDPYLSLYGRKSTDEDTSDPGVPNNLHLSDLAALVGNLPTLVVMDLCTDANYLADGKAALGRALDAIERSYRVNNVANLRVAAQLSDCKKKESFGRLVASAGTKLPEVRKAPVKTASLYASLRAEPGLIAVAQASQFKFAPSGEQRFWAVATSSANAEEARSASQRLKAQGITDSEVVLGINGVFSATLGPSVDSISKANDLIREARKNKLTELGYVLDGEKIKQVAK